MHVANIKDFSQQSDTFSSTDLFSHKLVKGAMRGSDKIWFCKEKEGPNLAKIELMAQEFFRLIIPQQPETRMALNTTNGVCYILSEAVDGYQDLPEGKAQQFCDGEITGLGQVVLISMFLEEIDLKNGNVGINDKNQVIKIDGDWCFASRSIDNTFQITPEGIG